MNVIFESVLTTGGLSVWTYLICLIVSLGLGCLIAFTGCFKKSCSQSIIITLIILPAIVQTVIMLVNGNIGTGVAVAGAFSLVRFRSAPGHAKDIAVIFQAMAVGIATGTGYLGIAVVFAIVVSAVFFVLTSLNIGGTNGEERVLKITIPESLDYEGVFSDLLQTYTAAYKLTQVKTTNMGSLYRLTYNIKLKKDTNVKEFIDKLRCRNGNLEISCGHPVENEYGL